jgi:hypothetical protein
VIKYDSSIKIAFLPRQYVMSTAAAETTDQVDQDILPEIATISSSDNDNDNNEGLGNDISGQVNVEPAHSEGRIEEALGKSSNIPDDKSSESDSEIRSYSRYKPSARAVRFNGVLPLRARLAGTSASSGIESVHREKVRVRPSWRKRTERRPVKISPPNVIAKIEGMGWVDFADSIRRFDPPASLPFGLSDKHYPSSDENAPPQDVAAIEVLVGEPCVTVGIKADNTTENRTSTQPLLFEMSGTKDENTTTSEDLQLRMRSPARIRFNSQFLIHTLFKYKSQNFVVLVRPFRFLLTNEERIRSIYQQLELEAGMPHADRSTTNARRSQPPDLSSRAVISSKATKLEAMKCLVQLIDEYILPRVSFVRGFDCTRIYFDDLWHLFRPGDRVFHLVNANAAVDIEVLRVICVQGVEHRVRRHRNGPSNRAYGSPFMIYCVAIDFDGKQLGPRKKQYAVDYFEGDKGVRSLPIMPINRLKDDEIQRQLVHNGINFPECQDEHEILQSIVARGKAFLGMTETKHMHFSGTTSFGEELDCPVMIDFDQAFASPEAQGGRTEAKRYPGWKPDLESLVEWTPPENEDSVECLSDCCKHHNVYLDRYMDKENSAAYLDSLTRRDNSKMHSLAIHPRYRHDANTEENPIEDDEFLIMPWKVYGFVFQIRKFSESCFAKFSSYF